MPTHSIRSGGPINFIRDYEQNNFYSTELDSLLSEGVEREREEDPPPKSIYIRATQIAAEVKRNPQMTSLPLSVNHITPNPLVTVISSNNYKQNKGVFSIFSTKIRVF